MGNKKLPKLKDDEKIAIAEFLVEDYRFRRSYMSMFSKLFQEETKRYESAYLFHKNQINTLCEKLGLKISDFEGKDYDDGYPITPLNADEFERNDLLVIEQTIEPTILTTDGKLVRSGTVLLALKKTYKTEY